MKPLVVYYTRDGHTEDVAKSIALHLKGTVRRVEEKAKRKGVLGYLLAGRDAMKEKEADLDGYDSSLASHSPVIFAGPVWAWKPAPAIMAAIKSHDLTGVKVVIIVTMGGNSGKSLEIMKAAVERRGGEVISSHAILSARKTAQELREEAKKVAQAIKERMATSK